MYFHVLTSAWSMKMLLEEALCQVFKHILKDPVSVKAIKKIISDCFCNLTDCGQNCTENTSSIWFKFDLFSYAVTLNVRARSPKSDQVFPMP